MSTRLTLDELRDEFDATCDYDLDGGGIPKAQRHIAVCRKLLGRLEESVGIGSGHVRNETKKYERLIQAARTYIRANRRTPQTRVTLQEPVDGNPLFGGRR